MRLKWLRCFFMAVLVMVEAGCTGIVLGGGTTPPSGPQPTGLTVTVKGGAGCTKTSPCGFSIGPTPLQLEATATFADGATQNYTSTATWTASP